MTSSTEPNGGWQDALTADEIYYEEIGQHLEEDDDEDFDPIGINEDY